MPGMDYDEYLKKQQELTEEQLKEQSAKNAAATANALGSAAVAYNDAKAIATSGGYSDMKSDYTPVTEESVAADTSTKGPTDEKAALPDYGLRNDGTKKGNGWLGPINLPNGDVATEYSIGVDFDGKETEIPTLVPTLTPEEVSLMRDDIIPNNKPVPEGIAQKAIEHAKKQMSEGKSVWAEEKPADEPAEKSDWDKAQDDYKKTMEDIANEQKEINAERQKQFDAMVFDYKERMKREEEEMRQREQGNMMSTMATGATEVAAGIINMLGVGELHASNQTYHSRDWMAKAEQDIKDHRRKRDGMYDTMQRLKMQQEQVRTSGRIEEMKLKQQQAIAALREAERQKEKEDREAKAKADRDADMLARGFVPDSSDPSGYRFDPDLAGQIATAKKTGTATKSSTANGTATATKPKQDTAAGGSTSSTASQPKAQSNGTAGQGTGKSNSASGKGSVDYAYRMPLTEKEYQEKRNLYGWEDPKAGTPPAPSKKKKDWSGYIVK